MPIIPKHQAITTEDKIAKAFEIIGKIHNKLDADFLKLFLLDICQRYCDKIYETNQLSISSSLKSINTYEVEYIERIIKEFKQE